MTYAREVGTVPVELLASLRAVASVHGLRWKISREYLTLDVTEQLSVPLAEFFKQPIVRAFFLKLPPDCRVHRHVDAGDVVTHHIPVVTNHGAMSCWSDLLGDHEMHLAFGKLYEVERTVEHWAVNYGRQPRIHLIVETRRSHA